MNSRETEYIGKKIEYQIFDPTGNITALVETQADPADQPSVAAGIMALHPEVEQVGFVTFADDSRDEGAAAGAGAPAADGAAVSLRMAGGEFCGNAAMCAAAFYVMKIEEKGGAPFSPADSGRAGGARAEDIFDLKVKVSGAGAPLEVRLARKGAAGFAAAVTMPPAKCIDELRLSDGMLSGSDSLRLPIVRMQGIDHIIIEPDSGFFGLKEDKALAETLLRGWCGAIGTDCLGMMFLSGGEDDAAGACDNGEACVRALTPLVYVPGADTMFWENSCASGSVAAGIYLADKTGKPVDITFDEPAGRLRVESDPASGRTVLYGSVLLS